VNGTIITRIWHGWTTPTNADAYEHLLVSHVLPEIHRVAGYLGAELLRGDRGAEVEFVTITRFDSWEAVSRFAGDDLTAAVVPPEARELLSRFDEHAEHFAQVVRADSRS
jgi:antibiotic biosynthesis monooxygenase (ABM) superfamily enzyme